MFKLFRNLKPMTLLIVFVIILVAGQAVAELYLPQKMSEIIDNGIYLDYEPLYKHLTMDKPSSISGVDSERTMKGYEEDKIPVFEMVDGFSTYDLTDALNEADPTLHTGIRFQDIPIKDSKQLFNDVLTPFLDGLEPYQHINADFNEDYTKEEQNEIIRIINSLIVLEKEKPETMQIINGKEVWTYYFTKESIVIDSEKEKITLNSLLDRDPNEDEDEDAMDNETNRKIITACISRMKHSKYGNLMPIPEDKNGNRLATDSYGQVIETDKIQYIYSDKKDNEVYTAKQSETGRPDPMPDYEVIMCNNVFGFAYKYVEEKWVENKLGILDEKGREKANTYNSKLLIDNILTSNKFDEAKIDELSDKIESIVKKYQAEDLTDVRSKNEEDSLLILTSLMNYSNRSAKAIEKRINKFYDGKITGFDIAFIKLSNYLTLSPTGTAKEKGAALELKSAKDMMVADGKTIQTRDFGYIITRGGYMLMLTICACACAYIAAAISAKIAAEFSAIIRSKVFSKVETFSFNEFDKFSTASLTTRSTNDINQIQTVFLLVLRTALIAPFTVVGGFILSADKSVPMTLVILYPFPILIIASVVASKVVFPLFSLIQKKVDNLTRIMREGITGIRVVRAFNQQERERVRFAKVNDSVTKTAITVYKYCAVLAPLISVCMYCTSIGIYWVASKQVADPTADINVGDMMAVTQYITQIMLALVMLATVFVMFPRASASALRVNEVLETDLTILDSAKPDNGYTSVGSVEFRDVNFKYSNDAEKYILSNINFKANKGEVTAIVGGTGSGKSSVINLIPRFYDIESGKILVDGVDIKDIEQEELRAKIGFVPQRSVLFSGTIRSNLLYGKEDATEEELWEALEIAQSSTFVSEKESGLESRVEQGGGNFSGGQKQRLAIARAIIRKPEILIFDDSFSALDFRTDKNLRTALKRITQESATIIVAQRIGTIMDADNIIVLDEGRIAAQGKHDYLVHHCKLYRDIALSQMSEEELGL
ncbi:MAG: ABC transporter ATP-binding protein [Clostridia bacterium]|nr:ABC transporter ATP-binding protein [Clostridia bacterium]